MKKLMGSTKSLSPVLGIALIVVALVISGVFFGGLLGDQTQAQEQGATQVENTEFHSDSNVEKVAIEDLANIFEEFGLEEPEDGAPLDMETYNEAGEKIDAVLTATGLEDVNEETIIGILEAHGFQIVLVDRDDEVMEIAAKEGKTTTFTLTPELLGCKGSRAITEQRGEYTLTHTSGINLHKLEIPIPAGGVSPLYNWIITVERDDSWNIGESELLLHTEGKFYVDKGDEVESIIDNSYTETATGFSNCEFNHSSSGEGSSVGHVDADSLWAQNTGPVTTKWYINAWVSCDYLCNTDSDGHGDKWVAY
ncbi:MAG: hypothetical protein ACOC5C_06745, partial [Halobacteriota archaeon]